MLKELFEFTKQVVSLARDTQQNKVAIGALEEEVKDLRRELRDLSETVHHLARDLQHLREHERLRENLAKDLQIALLQFERRPLPPPGEELS